MHNIIILLILLLFVVSHLAPRFKPIFVSTVLIVFNLTRHFPLWVSSYSSETLRCCFKNIIFQIKLFSRIVSGRTYFTRNGIIHCYDSDNYTLMYICAHRLVFRWTDVTRECNILLYYLYYDFNKIIMFHWYIIILFSFNNRIAYAYIIHYHVGSRQTMIGIIIWYYNTNKIIIIS